jgi:hypothetical protein
MFELVFAVTRSSSERFEALEISEADDGRKVLRERYRRNMKCRLKVGIAKEILIGNMIVGTTESVRVQSFKN